MRPHVILHTALALSLAIVPTATPLQAQANIGIRGSTLGIGVEVGYRHSRHLGFRASGNMFSLDIDQEVEGIDYTLTPDLQSFGATVDFFPFGSVLYFSGGLLANQNKATAEAIIDGPITIGSRTYSSSEVQSLRADLDWPKSLAPYLGLGFATGGRVGLALEFGVAFSGTPTVDLSGTTSFTGSQKAQFDQAVMDEEAEIRAWINDNERWAKYYPVVALGLRIKI